MRRRAWNRLARAALLDSRPPPEAEDAAAVDVSPRHRWRYAPVDRYDEIARCVVETDRELAAQLIAMLHHMARLDYRVDPGVGRARDLQASLREALANLTADRPQVP